MNESIGSDSSPGSYGESDDSTGEKVFEYASEYGPTDLDDLRELASSGAITGLGGAVTIVRGLRSLRRGETGRGLFRLATGALLVALAVAQRRTRDGRSEGRDTGAFDQTDVAGTGSDTDLEDVSSGLDTSDEGTETDTDPAEVIDTGSDVEDVSSGLDSEDRRGSRGDTDQTDVVDTGLDTDDIDAGSDLDAEDEGGHRSDAGEAGVSTDAGEVGIEETNVNDTDDTDDEEESEAFR